jgi:hypothetical protein
MSDVIIFVVVIAVLGVGIIYSIFEANATEASKNAYLQALRRLKEGPTNADIKQEALGLGRAYSNRTRDKKGRTLFDEVALMNDINAACAASSKPTTTKRVIQIGSTHEDRLSTLENLRNKGLISNSEYTSRRTDILGSI